MLGGGFARRWVFFDVWTGYYSVRIRLAVVRGRLDTLLFLTMVGLIWVGNNILLLLWE